MALKFDADLLAQRADQLIRAHVSAINEGETPRIQSQIVIPKLKDSVAVAHMVARYVDRMSKLVPIECVDVVPLGVRELRSKAYGNVVSVFVHVVLRVRALEVSDDLHVWWMADQDVMLLGTWFPWRLDDLADVH